MRQSVWNSPVLGCEISSAQGHDHIASLPVGHGTTKGSPPLRVRTISTPWPSSRAQDHAAVQLVGGAIKPDMRRVRIQLELC